MDEYKDEQLVQNFLNGDERSFDFLVQKYFKLIYSFAARTVNSREEAEDLTQIVFVKTWSNIKKFDLDKNFKTWIFSIAKNAIIDHLRKKKYYIFSSLDPDDNEGEDFSSTIIDENISPLESLEKEELKKDLEAVLTKIPTDDRILLLLYYNQEMNFREIAEILKEPIDTIKSRHRRALIKLRKILPGTIAPK